MLNQEQGKQIYALLCVFFRDNHQREEEAVMENKQEQEVLWDGWSWIKTPKWHGLPQVQVEQKDLQCFLRARERSRSLLRNCLLAVYKANHRNQRYPLGFTQGQAVFRLCNKGSDRRTITVIVRKIICFLWPPRRGNVRQTSIVYFKGICSNYYTELLTYRIL